MSSSISYSQSLAEKKNSKNVKENQTSKQTREGLAYNTRDPRSVANTSSKKTQAISASNISYK